MAESGIAHIEDNPVNPFELFTTWYEEVKSCGHLQPDAFSFSTASKDGVVSSRHVILRQLDPDGVILVTDRRSKKSKEINEHPQAAATFLWVYKKGNNKISKQVRMEGQVKELKPEEYVEIYNREPFFCKMRSHVCHQGQPTTWEHQKEKHDKIYEDFMHKEKDLSMPDHFVGYKFTPTMFDFYYAYDNFFGDRLCYLKEEGEWRNFHINT